jgi:hypothetical protein
LLLHSQLSGKTFFFFDQLSGQKMILADSLICMIFTRTPHTFADPLPVSLRPTRSTQNCSGLPWLTRERHRRRGCVGAVAPGEEPRLGRAWRVTVSLPSIITTADITGRAAGSPWTHSSPTWTHLCTSPAGKLPTMLGSTNSATVPASQCSHTCTIACNRKPNFTATWVTVVIGHSD